MRIVVVFVLTLLTHFALAQSFYANSSDAIVKLSVTGDSVDWSGYAIKSITTPVAEGLVAVEDSAGHLLFVADGSGLYDKTGKLVPQSDNILAHYSSSEMAVCPVVGHPDEYYIFYNTEQCSGLYYSIVRADAQGVQMVKTNVPLDTSRAYAEGLEIIKNPCKNQYFLVGFACQEGFRTFSLDTVGISASSDTQYDLTNFSGRGMMTYRNGKLGYALAFSNKILLANFDSHEGSISAVEEVTFPATNGAYGIAFTQNAEKVFVTDWNNRNIFGQSVSPNLFAYDLTHQRTASWTIDLPNTGSEQFGLSQIMLTSEGKLLIPVAGTSYIVLISYPERAETHIEKLATKGLLSYGITQPLSFPRSNPAKIAIDGRAQLCEEETVVLRVEESIYNTYQWLQNQQPIPQATTPTLTVSEAGQYSLVTETKAGCADTLDQITITKAFLPSIDLVDTIRSCASEPIVLHYPDAASYQMHWSTGDTTAQISVYEAGVYWLQISNGHCSIIDTVVVSFSTHGTLEIPNVFTPNDDAYNQYFEISAPYRSLTLSIYNRWGTLVYYSDDYQNTWSADNLAAGSYYYVVSENDGCLTFHRGWVSIIR